MHVREPTGSHWPLGGIISKSTRRCFSLRDWHGWLKVWGGGRNLPSEAGFIALKHSRARGTGSIHWGSENTSWERSWRCCGEGKVATVQGTLTCSVSLTQVHGQCSIPGRQGFKGKWKVRLSKHRRWGSRQPEVRPYGWECHHRVIFQNLQENQALVRFLWTFCLPWSTPTGVVTNPQRWDFFWASLDHGFWTLDAWQRCFILPELQESLLAFPLMSLLTQSLPAGNHLQTLLRGLSAFHEEVPVLLLEEHHFYQSIVTEIDSVTIWKTESELNKTFWREEFRHFTLWSLIHKGL